jgi:hypothetical protein
MLKRLFTPKPRPASTDYFAQVTSQVDDSPGWQNITPRRHERDYAEIQELYTDALTAWRKNPIAWRAISITSDYVIGSDFHIHSPLPELERFIQAFWNHPKNLLDLRLVPMCDELSRSGDLFAALFRDPAGGMSYLRLVTKDCIQRIVTEPDDWETEIEYHETPSSGGQVTRGQVTGGQVTDLPLQARIWHSPNHPEAPQQPAILLHYAVNRPVGALMGESDLATMIPWLLRYSRMLEDRLRLHWAARAFLYLVTVPSNKVESKAEQYRAAPEAGSIIVKDETESWETMTPSLRGADASHDMKAVRNLIDAGSGFPPHWRGEGGDVNLATAEAMQGPPERHLAKRQQYFVYIIEDILYHAYQRAAGLGFYPALPTHDYAQLFSAEVPDVSLRDNTLLAQSARDMAQALSVLQQLKSSGAEAEFIKLAQELVLKFAGVKR